MNCIVIDRNRQSRSIIEDLIRQTPLLNLLESFTKVEFAAEAFLANNEVDIVFLDVKMTGISDIRFIETLQSNNSQLIIIANTTRSAQDAFDFNATDHLIQPVTHERFMRSVKKARRLNAMSKVSVRPNERIFVKL